jgi:hypothetical protein
MKVRQLLDLLADYSPEAEVHLVHQRNYPLESHLAGVVGASEIREHEGRPLGDDDPEIVYLLEGRQLGYGRVVAWTVAEER